MFRCCWWRWWCWCWWPVLLLFFFFVWKLMWHGNILKDKNKQDSRQQKEIQNISRKLCCKWCWALINDHYAHFQIEQQKSFPDHTLLVLLHKINNNNWYRSYSSFSWNKQVTDQKRKKTGKEKNSFLERSMTIIRLM